MSWVCVFKKITIGYVFEIVLNSEASIQRYPGEHRIKASIMQKPDPPPLTGIPSIKSAGAKILSSSYVSTCCSAVIFRSHRCLKFDIFPLRELVVSTNDLREQSSRILFSRMLVTSEDVLSPVPEHHDVVTCVGGAGLLEGVQPRRKAFAA